MVLGLDSNAQVISGTVYDDGNIRLPYALVMAHHAHIHTNESGNFTLSNCAVGDTIFFTHLGLEKYNLVLTAESFQMSHDIIMKTVPYNLNEIEISHSKDAFQELKQLDLKLNPVQSSQEVLEEVPGLIISQHAGGGKAEQIFLRGFDIDHGTDITISIDGMPVNMPSHAHGQGYADLHFLIPESISKIEFGKGPYYSHVGNFNTAGYVEFKTLDRIRQNSFGLEYGAYNFFRAQSSYQIVDQEKSSAYVMGEFISFDGPFQSPQNFERINLFGKYTYSIDHNQILKFSASHFTSDWFASGQIPQRALDSGLIDRFGSIDDTEGGSTSRTNISLEYSNQLSNDSYFKIQSFYNKYDFELFSNFTFFQQFDERGDQIRQYEDRHILGLKSTFINDYSFLGHAAELEIGIDVRYDNVPSSELTRTQRRVDIGDPQSIAAITETNSAIYIDNVIEYDKISLYTGLRLESILFKNKDLLDPTNTDYRTKRSTVLLPSFSLTYIPTDKVQLFLKGGIGYHSNHSLVSTQNIQDNTLPLAYGTDLGILYKPHPGLWLSLSNWYMDLETEFVYVGDENIVEPSGPTRRLGIELNVRNQFSPKLYSIFDINYTYARFKNLPMGEDFIPLAVDLTAKSKLIYDFKSLKAGIEIEYLKDRSANEDNSVIAQGYVLVNTNVHYRIGKFELGLTVDNLFNTEWNEAQFATLSRLENESEGIEELHFTPGIPFMPKLSFKYIF